MTTFELQTLFAAYRVRGHSIHVDDYACGTAVVLNVGPLWFEIFLGPPCAARAHEVARKTVAFLEENFDLLLEGQVVDALEQ